MSRVELIVAAAVAVMGVALAGCSALPSLPGFGSSSSSPPMQPLRFETDPPGAEAQTMQGQTCQTPCALPVPSRNQTVTFSKTGYVTQTVQVTANPPPSHPFWESPSPTLTPNPVLATLQPVPPPRRVYRRRYRHHRAVRRRTVRTRPQRRRTTSPFPNPPSTRQPSQSVFPPPPPIH